MPQIRGMHGGDRSRKQTLVEYGFRLPAALDNRPLQFDEYQALTGQTIYVSATPADFELQQSEGVYVEQLIRPTGLLDPVIEVRPSLNQVDDLIDEIHKVIEKPARFGHDLDKTHGRGTEYLSQQLENQDEIHPFRCRYHGAC